MAIPLDEPDHYTDEEYKAVQAALADPESIQTHAEAVLALRFLELEIADIEAQLEEARRYAVDTSEPVNRDWAQRARYAIQRRRITKARIQRRDREIRGIVSADVKAELAYRQQKDERAAKVATEWRNAFVTIVRETVPVEQYKSFVAAAKAAVGMPVQRASNHRPRPPAAEGPVSRERMQDLAAHFGGER